MVVGFLNFRNNVYHADPGRVFHVIIVMNRKQEGDDRDREAGINNRAICYDRLSYGNRLNRSKL